MNEVLDLLSVAAGSPILIKTWKYYFGGPKKWTIKQYIRDGHYDSKPNHTVGFVAFKLIKGRDEHIVRPDIGKVGLDPMEDNFSEKLANYWAKAEEAVAMMNAYDKS